MTKRGTLRKTCQPCQSAKDRAVYERRKDRAKAKSKEYYHSNVEKGRADRKAWREKNRDRVNAQSREWRKANAEYVREYGRLKGRQFLLKCKYNMSLADYEAMLSLQGGVCAICKTATPGTGKMRHSFHVDHCHSTGKVRGLLCHRCNQGIGLLREDIDVLRSAIDYLSSARKSEEIDELDAADSLF